MGDRKEKVEEGKLRGCILREGPSNHLTQLNNKVVTSGNKFTVFPKLLATRRLYPVMLQCSPPDCRFPVCHAAVANIGIRHVLTDVGDASLFCLMLAMVSN